MTSILSRVFCNLFIVFSAIPSVKASFSDTTKLMATNVSKTNTAAAVITSVIASNVEYPSVLEDHRDESMEYVKSFSTKQREYLIRTFQKGKSFFPKVAAVLKKYGVPQELKVLIALESAFNPNAKSGAGAYGYWQFMDNAAKEYGLRIVEAKDAAMATMKKIKDERTNFSKSTHAAARYLRDRCKELNNNVLLMVASYNWGIGNIRNAIRKTGKSNASFWDIKKYLPSETKAYVMKFIALNVVYHNYDKFLRNKLKFENETIQIPVHQLNPAIESAPILD